MAEATRVPGRTGSKWALMSKWVEREQISLFTTTASICSGSLQILWATSLALIPAFVVMEEPSGKVSVIVFIDSVYTRKLKTANQLFESGFKLLSENVNPQEKDSSLAFTTAFYFIILTVYENSYVFRLLLSTS